MTVRLAMGAGGSVVEDSAMGLVEGMGVSEGNPLPCCGICGSTMNDDKESYGYCLHHVKFGSERTTKRTISKVAHFKAALNALGEEHFRNVEKLQVLCKGCHALLHAEHRMKRANLPSDWARKHKQVVDLLGGMCEECLVEDIPTSLLHVHHIDRAVKNFFYPSIETKSLSTRNFVVTAYKSGFYFALFYAITSN